MSSVTATTVGSTCGPAPSPDQSRSARFQPNWLPARASATVQNAMLGSRLVSTSRWSRKPVGAAGHIVWHLGEFLYRGACRAAFGVTAAQGEVVDTDGVAEFGVDGAPCTCDQVPVEFRAGPHSDRLAAVVGNHDHAEDLGHHALMRGELRVPDRLADGAPPRLHDERAADQSADLRRAVGVLEIGGRYQPHGPLVGPDHDHPRCPG